MARAPIVCNGEVIELENTLEKGMAVLPHYEKNFCIPVEFWKAKIKVLSTFKGKVPDEIELRFPQIDQHPLNDKTTIISDGPIQISLKPKGRYRFFLEAVPGQKWYVGVVDGDFDDGYAVQPLEDKESDDSPLFLKEEALKLATDYVRLLKPNAKVSEWSIEASESGLSRWNVTFWWPPAHIHDFDPSAEIGIEGNRDIDPRSWVSDGTPLSVSNLKPGDVGREYRVYFNAGLRDSFYDTSTLRGHFKRIVGEQVELADVQTSDWKPRSWPTLAIPIGDIRELQRLIPPGPPWPTPTP